MKKVISASMAIVILLSFAACSSAEYTDTPVTVAVTDENGEEVTDKDGKAVTEIVEESSQADSQDESTASNSGGSNASDSSDSGNSSDSGSSSGGNANTQGGSNTASGGGSAGSDSTTKKSASDSTTTTAAPKKRDIDVTVNLPYFNEIETELTVFYKVDGDKKYTKLETEEVVLDKVKKKTYTIKKVKGEVTVYVELKDISATQCDAIVKADETRVTISPVTGIEVLDGGLQ